MQARREAAGTTPFGHALRQWRISRGLSQLALSGSAGTPTRHISFLETGRARPSREMVLRLAEALGLPLDARNELLGLAGYPPAYTAHALGAEALAPIRDVIARILAQHMPLPALVLDRWYDILDANPVATRAFLGGHRPDPDDPPNLIELLIGPLRPALLNAEEVIADGLRRLRREVRLCPDDARLEDMLRRVEGVASRAGIEEAETATPVLMTRMRVGGVLLSTLSTLVHFGGVHDVTVDGLHLELIFPADAATDAFFRAIASAG